LWTYKSEGCIAAIIHNYSKQQIEPKTHMDWTKKIAAMHDMAHGHSIKHLMCTYDINMEEPMTSWLIWSKLQKKRNWTQQDKGRLHSTAWIWDRSCKKEKLNPARQGRLHATVAMSCRRWVWAVAVGGSRERGHERRCWVHGTLLDLLLQSMAVQEWEEIGLWCDLSTRGRFRLGAGGRGSGG
jgi:hypothetical protein